MPKNYANPTYDFVFKKVFGDKNHKNITINFLNNALKLDKENLIVDISFDDPHIRKENQEDGYSIVDIYCTDQKKKNYLIEMQRIDEKDFPERMQYYCAKGLANQLAGEKKIYKHLKPVVIIGVIDFNLFESYPGFVSNHAITCTQDNKIYFNHLSFCLVELKKFNKKEHELVDDIDRWIFFMNNAAGYVKKPEVVAKDNQAIIDAFDIVDKANWEIEDLIAYEKNIDEQRVRESEVATALERGLEKGREEGEKNALIATARNMLAEGIDAIIIAKVTGLDVAAIKKLKN